MKTNLLIVVTTLIIFFAGYSISTLVSVNISDFFNFYKSNKNSQKSNIIFYDASKFSIEGLLFPSSIGKNSYKRLPKQYKSLVNCNVWEQSNYPTGVSVTFQSNSNNIWIRWKISKKHRKPHMTDLGIRGIDLYTLKDSIWRFVNAGIPQGRISCQQLINTKVDTWNDYKLYLPLFTKLELLEIGIDTDADIKTLNNKLVQPIIFYGTSITQGACVSRPGLAYTNIISRELDIECINLGFSACGKMDMDIAEILGSVDAKFIIVDCLPNMKLDEVMLNVIPFVLKIRERNKNIPIVLVEWFGNKSITLNKEKNNQISCLNNMLCQQYQIIKDKGIKGVYYFSFKDTMEDFNRWTTDITHLNDYGSVKYANLLIDKLKSAGLLIEKECRE